MMVGPRIGYPNRQKHNIRKQMEKIIKSDTQSHQQISWNNADKWEQEPGSAVFIRSHRLSCTSTCLRCPIKFQQFAALEASRQKPNNLQTGQPLQGETTTELSIISQLSYSAFVQGNQKQNRIVEWIRPLLLQPFTLIIIDQIILVTHLHANHLLSPKVRTNYRFSIEMRQQ